MESPSSSTTEVVLPISSQKHDPAWKHCLLIKKGDKNHLKCMYCVKLFSGGGIHRIKEHLACQKGNASSCSKVPADVRDSMLQSLESVVSRKRKKHRLAELVQKLSPVANQIDTFVTTPEADNSPPLLALPINFSEPGFSNESKKEEAQEALVVTKNTERGRKKRGKMSPVPFTGNLDVGRTETDLTLVRQKERGDVAIAQFIYEAGLPLEAVNSIYFQPMVDAIASAGPGFVVPSYHDLRNRVLKITLEGVRNKLEQWKLKWGRSGCSVLADEWTTDLDRTLINFLIYCPEGTMFLKSVDATQIVTSPDALYELLKHVVEEVGVRNVVQVITNNTETHAIAGKRLTDTFPTMFWTPCAARCVDAMLEDFGKFDHISTVLDQAKSITVFIYSHAKLLNLMRRYTGGKELLQASISKNASNFLTLKNIANLRDNLEAMINSQDWKRSTYSKSPAGSAVADLIFTPSFWSSCASIGRLTEPLLRVLKIAGSSFRPGMGYIDMSLRCAKEKIKRELQTKREYLPYWNIIDWRWDQDLPRPLYTAGFFLNPQFFYSVPGEIPNEIMSGMLDCIERLIPEAKVQDKINKELNLYKSGSGDFGRKMAVRARDTLLPAEWWSTYGGGCPNLARLAIRILSQTCSARLGERNHIPFEQIHNQRKNGLEHQRFCDLIFVQYNLRLQRQQLLRNKSHDPTSIDKIDYLEDWLVEKDDLFSDHCDSSWKELDQPISCGALSRHEEEEADLFTSGFDEGVPGAADEDDTDEVKEESAADIKAVSDGYRGRFFANNLMSNV